MEILVAMLFFGACFGAMALGVIVSNRALRGSCGGPTVLDPEGDPLSCGACPKQESEVCPSDDPLVRLAQVTHPDPRHHR